MIGEVQSAQLSQRRQKLEEFRHSRNSATNTQQQPMSTEQSASHESNSEQEQDSASEHDGAAIAARHAALRTSLSDRSLQQRQAYPGQQLAQAQLDDAQQVDRVGAEGFGLDRAGAQVALERDGSPTLVHLATGQALAHAELAKSGKPEAYLRDRALAQEAQAAVDAELGAELDACWADSELAQRSQAEADAESDAQLAASLQAAEVERWRGDANANNRSRSQHQRDSSNRDGNRGQDEDAFVSEAANAPLLSADASGVASPAVYREQVSFCSIKHTVYVACSMEVFGFSRLFINARLLLRLKKETRLLPNKIKRAAEENLYN